MANPGEKNNALVFKTVLTLTIVQPIITFTSKVPPIFTSTVPTNLIIVKCDNKKIYK